VPRAWALSVASALAIALTVSACGGSSGARTYSAVEVANTLSAGLDVEVTVTPPDAHASKGTLLHECSEVAPKAGWDGDVMALYVCTISENFVPACYLDTKDTMNCKPGESDENGFRWGEDGDGDEAVKRFGKNVFLGDFSVEQRGLIPPPLRKVDTALTKLGVNRASE
jgi:hypothetical protein